MVLIFFLVGGFADLVPSRDAREPFRGSRVGVLGGHGGGLRSVRAPRPALRPVGTPDGVDLLSGVRIVGGAGEPMVSARERRRRAGRGGE